MSAIPSNIPGNDPSISSGVSSGTSSSSGSSSGSSSSGETSTSSTGSGVSSGSRGLNVLGSGATITTPVPTKPAKVGTIPAQTGPVGSPFSLDLSPYFSGGSLTYTVTSPATLPSTLTLSGSMLTGTYPDLKSLAITIKATNTAGNISQSFTMTPTADPVSTVSNLTTILASLTTSLANTKLNDPLNIAASSFFSGSTTSYPVSYSAVGLPKGLSINATTGAITGNVSAIGTFLITVTAKDSATPNGVPVTFSLTVQDPVTTTNVQTPTNIPSVINLKDTANPLDIDASVLFATSGTLPLTYSATGLPCGLSLDKNTGHITGVVTSLGGDKDGVFNIVVTAKDLSTAPGAQASFPLTIVYPPPTKAPTIPAKTGMIGSPFPSIDLTQYFGSGNGTVSYSLTFTPPMNPPPLQVNGSTLISANGNYPDLPPFSVKVTATNSAGSTSEVFRVTSQDIPVTLTGNPPVIVPTPPFTVGDVVSVDISGMFAGNTTTYPTTYSVSGLPSGLKLNNATGVISGTVTKAGPFNMVIAAAKDKATPTPLQAPSFSLTVNPNLTASATNLTVNLSTNTYTFQPPLFSFGSNAQPTFKISGLASEITPTLDDNGMLIALTANLPLTKPITNNRVTITAKDIFGETASIKLTVNVIDPSIPTFTAPTTPLSLYAINGQSVDLTQVLHAQGPNLQYSISYVPLGFNFDQATGKLTLQNATDYQSMTAPSYLDSDGDPFLDMHNTEKDYFKVTVLDEFGYKASGSIFIKIFPNLIAKSPTAVTSGIPVTYGTTASAGPVTYSLSSALTIPPTSVTGLTSDNAYYDAVNFSIDSTTMATKYPGKTFTVTELPNGTLQLNVSGLTVGNNQKFSVVVDAKDPNSGEVVKVTFPFTVSVPKPTLQAANASGISNLSVGVNGQISYSALEVLFVTQQQQLSFTLQNLLGGAASGFSFDANGNLIVGTTAQSGNYNLVASDSFGNTGVIQEVHIQANTANPIILSLINGLGATQSNPINLFDSTGSSALLANFTDNTQNSTLQFSLTGPDASHFTIDPNTGRISPIGSSIDNGIYQVGIHATEYVNGQPTGIYADLNNIYVQVDPAMSVPSGLSFTSNATATSESGGLASGTLDPSIDLSSVAYQVDPITGDIPPTVTISSAQVLDNNNVIHTLPPSNFTLSGSFPNFSLSAANIPPGVYSINLSIQAAGSSEMATIPITGTFSIPIFTATNSSPAVNLQIEGTTTSPSLSQYIQKDNQTLTFTLANPTPGVTVSQTGEISIANSIVPATYPLQVNVTDGIHTSPVTLNVSLQVAPSITSSQTTVTMSPGTASPDYSNASSALSIVLTDSTSPFDISSLLGEATGVNNSSLIVSLDTAHSSPYFTRIDPQSSGVGGIILDYSLPVGSGTYTALLNVQDPNAPGEPIATVPVSLTITVPPPNLTFTPPQTLSAQLEGAGSPNLSTYIDTSGQPGVSLSLVSPPSGISILNGVITATPPATSTSYPLTLQVQDAYTTKTVSVTLNVTPALSESGNTPTTEATPGEVDYQNSVVSGTSTFDFSQAVLVGSHVTTLTFQGPGGTSTTIQDSAGLTTADLSQVPISFAGVNFQAPGPATLNVTVTDPNSLESEIVPCTLTIPKPSLSTQPSPSVTLVSDATATHSTSLSPSTLFSTSGQQLSYTASVVPPTSGVSYDPTTGTLSVDPSTFPISLQNTSLTISVQATDQYGNTPITNSISLTVKPPITETSNAPLSTTANSSDVAYANATVSATYTFSLSSNLTENGSDITLTTGQEPAISAVLNSSGDAVVTFTGASFNLPGLLNFNITANAPNGESIQVPCSLVIPKPSFTLNPSNLNGNGHASLTTNIEGLPSSPLTSFFLSQGQSFGSYTITSGSSGLHIDSLGQISVTLPTTLQPGTRLVQVQATDAYGTTATLPIDLTLQAAIVPIGGPVFTTSNLASFTTDYSNASTVSTGVASGTTNSFNILDFISEPQGTTISNSNLSFNLNPASPSGFTLNATNGIPNMSLSFQGMPVGNNLFTIGNGNPVIIDVTDSESSETIQIPVSFQILVPNPTLLNSGAISTTLNDILGASVDLSTLNLAGQFITSGQPLTSYSLVSPPAGITLSGTTLSIDPTLVAAGTYPLSLKAMDVYGDNATITLTLTVDPAITSGSGTPSITASSVDYATGTVNSGSAILDLSSAVSEATGYSPNLSYQITTTGFTPSSYTSLSSLASVPINFSSLSFNPPEPISFTVNVKDNTTGEIVPVICSLSIPKPQLTATSDVADLSGYVLTSPSISTYFNHDEQGLNYTATGLPTGVILSPDGSLSIGRDASLGTTSGIQVTATDLYGNSATKTINLTVNPGIQLGSTSSLNTTATSINYANSKISGSYTFDLTNVLQKNFVLSYSSVTYTSSLGSVAVVDDQHIALTIPTDTSFTPSTTPPTTLSFTITATDNDTNPPEQVSIPGTITIPTPTFTAPLTASLSAQAEGQDTGPLSTFFSRQSQPITSFDFVGSHTGFAINTTTGAISVTDPTLTEGPFSLSVQGTDAYGSTATLSVSLTITPALQEKGGALTSPSIAAQSSLSWNGTENVGSGSTSLNLTSSLTLATGVQTNSLIYTPMNVPANIGISLSVSSPLHLIVNYTSVPVGNNQIYDFDVAVYDPTSLETVLVPVSLLTTVPKPTLQANTSLASLTAGIEGEASSPLATLFNTQGQTITRYDFVAPIPTGLTIDHSTGAISVDIPTTIQPGAYDYQVKATDMYGSTATLPITLTLQPSIFPIGGPIFNNGNITFTTNYDTLTSSGSTQSINILNSLSGSFQASNLVYSLDPSTPSNITLNATNGNSNLYFSWANLPVSIGSNSLTITLKVKDSASNETVSVPVSLQINVANTNLSPSTLDPISTSLNVVSNSAYNSIDLSSQIPGQFTSDTTALTYTLVSPPAGITLTNGVLKVDPTQFALITSPTTQTLTLQAQDAFGNIATRGLDLTLNPALYSALNSTISKQVPAANVNYATKTITGSLNLDLSSLLTEAPGIDPSKLVYSISGTGFTPSTQTPLSSLSSVAINYSSTSFTLTNQSINPVPFTVSIKDLVTGENIVINSTLTIPPPPPLTFQGGTVYITNPTSGTTTSSIASFFSAASQASLTFSTTDSITGLSLSSNGTLTLSPINDVGLPKIVTLHVQATDPVYGTTSTQAISVSLQNNQVEVVTTGYSFPPATIYMTDGTPPSGFSNSGVVLGPLLSAFVPPLGIDPEVYNASFNNCFCVVDSSGHVYAGLAVKTDASGNLVLSYSSQSPVINNYTQAVLAPGTYTNLSVGIAAPSGGFTVILKTVPISSLTVAGSISRGTENITVSTSLMSGDQAITTVGTGSAQTYQLNGLVKVGDGTTSTIFSTLAKNGVPDANLQLSIDPAFQPFIDGKVSLANATTNIHGFALNFNNYTYYNSSPGITVPILVQNSATGDKVRFLLQFPVNGFKVVNSQINLPTVNNSSVTVGAISTLFPTGLTSVTANILTTANNANTVVAGVQAVISGGNLTIRTTDATKLTQAALNTVPWTITGTDSSGNTVKVSLTNLRAGTLVTTPTFSTTPPSPTTSNASIWTIPSNSPPIPLTVQVLGARTAGLNTYTNSFNIDRTTRDYATGGTLLFGATSLPTGISIDQVTGAFSASASASPGTYQISVTISDGTFSDTRLVALTVTPLIQPITPAPTLTSTATTIDASSSTTGSGSALFNIDSYISKALYVLDDSHIAVALGSLADSRLTLTGTANALSLNYSKIPPGTTSLSVPIVVTSLLSGTTQTISVPLQITVTPTTSSTIQFSGTMSTSVYAVQGSSNLASQLADFTTTAGQPLSFSYSNLPAGVSVDSNNFLVVDPTKLQGTLPQTYSITVTAQDTTLDASGNPVIDTLTESLSLTINPSITANSGVIPTTSFSSSQINYSQGTAAGTVYLDLSQAISKAPGLNANNLSYDVQTSLVKVLPVTFSSLPVDANGNPSHVPFNFFSNSFTPGGHFSITVNVKDNASGQIVQIPCVINTPSPTLASPATNPSAAVSMIQGFSVDISSQLALIQSSGQPLTYSFPDLSGLGLAISNHTLQVTNAAQLTSLGVPGASFFFDVTDAYGNHLSSIPFNLSFSPIFAKNTQTVQATTSYSSVNYQTEKLTATVNFDLTQALTEAPGITYQSLSYTVLDDSENPLSTLGPVSHSLPYNANGLPTSVPVNFTNTVLSQENLFTNYPFKIQVKDNISGTTITLNCQLNLPPAAPIVFNSTGEALTVTALQGTQFDLTPQLAQFSTSPTNQAISFSYSTPGSGITISNNIFTIGSVPFGRSQITVTATDTYGHSVTEPVYIVIEKVTPFSSQASYPQAISSLGGSPVVTLSSSATYDPSQHTLTGDATIDLSQVVSVISPINPSQITYASSSPVSPSIPLPIPNLSSVPVHFDNVPYDTSTNSVTFTITLQDPITRQTIPVTCQVPVSGNTQTQGTYQNSSAMFLIGAPLALSISDASSQVTLSANQISQFHDSATNQPLTFSYSHFPSWVSTNGANVSVDFSQANFPVTGLITASDNLGNSYTTSITLTSNQIQGTASTVDYSHQTASGSAALNIGSLIPNQTDPVAITIDPSCVYGANLSISNLDDNATGTLTFTNFPFLSQTSSPQTYSIPLLVTNLKTGTFSKVNASFALTIPRPTISQTSGIAIDAPLTLSSGAQDMLSYLAGYDVNNQHVPGSISTSGQSVSYSYTDLPSWLTAQGTNLTITDPQTAYSIVQPPMVVNKPDPNVELISYLSYDGTGLNAGSCTLNVQDGYGNLFTRPSGIDVWIGLMGVKQPQIQTTYFYTTATRPNQITGTTPYDLSGDLMTNASVAYDPSNLSVSVDPSYQYANDISISNNGYQATIAYTNLPISSGSSSFTVPLIYKDTSTGATFPINAILNVDAVPKLIETSLLTQDGYSPLYNSSFYFNQEYHSLTLSSGATLNLYEILQGGVGPFSVFIDGIDTEVTPTTDPTRFILNANHLAPPPNGAMQVDYQVDNSGRIYLPALCVDSIGQEVSFPIYLPIHPSNINREAEGPTGYIANEPLIVVNPPTTIASTLSQYYTAPGSGLLFFNLVATDSNGLPTNTSANSGTVGGLTWTNTAADSTVSVSSGYNGSPLLTTLGPNDLPQYALSVRDANGNILIDLFGAYFIANPYNTLITTQSDLKAKTTLTWDPTRYGTKAYATTKIDFSSLFANGMFPYRVTLPNGQFIDINDSTDLHTPFYYNRQISPTGSSESPYITCTDALGRTVRVIYNIPTFPLIPPSQTQFHEYHGTIFGLGSTGAYDPNPALKALVSNPDIYKYSLIFRPGKPSWLSYSPSSDFGQSVSITRDNTVSLPIGSSTTSVDAVLTDAEGNELIVKNFLNLKYSYSVF